MRRKARPAPVAVMPPGLEDSDRKLLDAKVMKSYARRWARLTIEAGPGAKYREALPVVDQQGKRTGKVFFQQTHTYQKIGRRRYGKRYVYALKALLRLQARMTKRAA